MGYIIAFIRSSIFVLFKITLRSSIYTINNLRDNTPPCLTPLLTENEIEGQLPHGTCIVQNTVTLKIELSIPLFRFVLIAANGLVYQIYLYT